MKNASGFYKKVPLNIVGSTKFGRYPKMSSEETFNMIISDGWLVQFAGYRLQTTIIPNGEGRGIISSVKLKKLFAVFNNELWSFDSSLSGSRLGTLLTFSGDVFFAENNAGQIAVSDQQNLYVYNGITQAFDTLTESNPDLGFFPGQITFQDGYGIAASLGTNQWRLSESNNFLMWPNDAQHASEVSTKPTNTVGAIRFPGRGNLLLVFGDTVVEQWYDIGAKLFPYQRNQSINIDYGCINAATIDGNGDIVCWVSYNEKSGPAIMYTDGDTPKRISTDGIDFKLAQLNFPLSCYGCMLRLSGHVFYLVTWVKDNLSYLYDFNTDAFFSLCDENKNAFIVKRVAFFNNEYYFVSLRDGNLYRLSAQLFTYDYGNDEVFEIPLMRVLDSFELPDQSRFTISDYSFTIGQGDFDYTTIGPTQTIQDVNKVPCVDLCLSKDGGTNWGSNVRRFMNPQGKRANRLYWYQCGSANTVTPQFRFHALNGPFQATNGEMGVHQ